MPTPFSVAEIREAYLAFFAAKGCVRAPSASLVPANDPTTLFTVAGMSQFKDMFLGRGSAPFTRATTCQKCIRTNDILNVGRTPRHHTFFEMLGNFSFNDYFKRETIAWAWEFLTEVLKLDPERLYVTVNERDDEAWDIWQNEVGFPVSRMCRLGDADNFWPASAPTDGPTGPGGNCSEIFWDFEPEAGGGRNPGNDDSNRFVEIWNLVFPQFNVTEPKVDGRYTLQDLGRTNIDTGSGLERLACVVQGKRNNFDIDLLQIIVQRVAECCQVPYVEGALGVDAAAEERNALIRRIADHVRAVTFCIADGAVPANTGRGYIVRRLIRRATLDSNKLGVSACRLHEMVAAVVRAMGDAYPEIVARRDLAEQTLLAEEQSFRRTLDRGLELFSRALARHRSEGATQFSGDDVFELFTTFGFPKEVTAELAEAEGLPIDEPRFAERMEAFAEISKGGKQIEVFQVSALRDAKGRLGETRFVGYDRMETSAQLLLMEVEGLEVAQAPAGTALRLALDVTPFYAESGGQVADMGRICGADFEIRVLDVQKDEGLFIHSGEVVAGTATLGAVQAQVDAATRAATVRHHSVTHLMHAALGDILGAHVEQQGSKVEPAGLRFDFTHDSALDDQQLTAVESWVGEAIKGRHPVRCEEMPIAAARDLGAKALFGEKYGSVVRVVRMGEAAAPASIELCGGCHVSNTGDIAAFRIVREEAISAGVRRIQAVAGSVAEAMVKREQALAAALAEALGVNAPDQPRSQIQALARTFKVQPDELLERVVAQVDAARELATELGDGLRLSGDDILERVRSVAEEGKRLRKLKDQQSAAKAMAGLDALLDQPRMIAEIPLYAGSLEGVDGKALRQAAERITQARPQHLVVLASAADGKAFLVVAASPEAIASGFKAGELVSKLAPRIGGGGGGKPQFAQAGGKDPAAIPALMAELEDILQSQIGVGNRAP
ncbi:MAG: alanine--tRNA ligase [Planctomycetota bacterium]|nr:MAG: alanine--tRNA ligase [Planctomycetota bacterium]